MPDFSFAPDAPTDTPNTWRTCDGFHPTSLGDYRTGWLGTSAAISTAIPASQNYCFGYAYRLPTGTAQLVMTDFALSLGHTIVWDGSSWASRDGASSFKARTFAQVGNTTLAGGTGCGLVSRDASGTANFAAVGSGAPASVGVLLVNPLNIVIALDTASDAWATSDSNSASVWNSGEAASANLRQTYGKLTSGALLGNDVIAFKDKGVYRGSYVGGTLKWTWQLIDAERGAWGPGCSVSAEGKVYFIGRQGCYSFDGQTFERIDVGVWRRIVGLLGQSVALGGDYTETKLVWDSQTRNIFFFKQGGLNPVGSAGRSTGASCEGFFSYNVGSKKWGYQSRLADAYLSPMAIFSISPFNGYATSFISDASGSPLFNTDVGLYVPDLANVNDKVYALSDLFTPAGLPGVNYKPLLRTSRVGVRNRLTNVTRFTPAWVREDGGGTDLSTATVMEVLPTTYNSPFDSGTSQALVALSSNLYRADYTYTAAYHTAEVHINCDAVIAGGTFDMPMGLGGAGDI